MENIANRDGADLNMLLGALRDATRPFTEQIHQHEWESLAYHSDRRGLQLNNIDFMTGDTFTR